MEIPKTSEVIAKLRAGERPPASALRVFGNPVELAEGNGSDAKTVKVKLKARSRQPINHPYWGQIWHDLSTMRAKSKIALDYEHDEPIGYARTSTDEYGLICEGVVTPNPAGGDVASNVAHMLRSGIPMEASIDFSGEYDLVEIPEGMTSTCNGLPAPGPCIIVQNWPLRACAICKEGADATTSTEMLSGESSPLPRSISTFSQPKEPMQEPVLPTISPEAEKLTAVEGKNAELTAQLTAVQTERDALSQKNSELTQAVSDKDAQLKAKDDQITALTAQVEALKKPTVQPIHSTPEQAAPKTWAEALQRTMAENPGKTPAAVVELTASKYPTLSKVGTRCHNQ